MLAVDDDREEYLIAAKDIYPFRPFLDTVVIESAIEIDKFVIEKRIHEYIGISWIYIMEESRSWASCMYPFTTSSFNH